jgi:BirA family biotin operon repressor/biotin-[acetyl-CoA-carboxylase] ligase
MVTLFIGQKLQRFESLPSTNAYLKENMRTKGLAEGFTVVAKHQTLGRGQFGNSWHDAAGENLLFSVFLKPHFLSVDQQFALNMSVCLALVQCLNRYQAGFTIKWPNDILFDNQKLCGILIENSVQSNRLEASIVGIGLNVNQQKFTGVARATSLSLVLGHQLDLEGVLQALLKELEVHYLKLMNGDKTLKSRYLEQLYGYQQAVPVEVHGQEEMLTITDVDPQGRLQGLIRSEACSFAFKEVKFLR